MLTVWRVAVVRDTGYAHHYDFYSRFTAWECYSANIPTSQYAVLLLVEGSTTLTIATFNKDERL
jgi:hypothetical protein